MGTWVGLLVLAGLAFSPEPSAPAAPMPAHAVFAPIHTVSMTIDEPHDPGRATAGSTAGESLVGARWGTDIGWPQCGRALPDIDVDFVVVQVTSGRPGTVSSCLREQVAWARGRPSAINAYVVPGSPSAAELSAADRSGSCAEERSCMLRTAGAAAAAHALAGASAGGLDARGWWLDIEDVPARTLWGTDTDANTQVLIGWRDELRRAGKTVGVYSTRGYWRQIVGNWQADLPQWPAVGQAGVDAAQAACDRPFTSGPVLITQWLTGPLDANLLCPAQDRLASEFFGPFPRAVTAGVPSLLVTAVAHPESETALKTQAALEAQQAKADQDAEDTAAATTTTDQGATGAPSPAASARPRSTATATATPPTSTPTPKPKPTSTSTSQPTSTPDPTPTQTATPTPEPPATPTPTASTTPSPPAAAPTPTAGATAPTPTAAATAPTPTAGATAPMPTAGAEVP